MWWGGVRGAVGWSQGCGGVESGVRWGEVRGAVGWSQGCGVVESGVRWGGESQGVDDQLRNL